VTCCHDHDHDDVDVVDLTDGEEAQTETFHMCGDDCACGHCLPIEDGRVL
jgi:hypothetical protein